MVRIIYANLAHRVCEKNKPQKITNVLQIPTFSFFSIIKTPFLLPFN